LDVRKLILKGGRRREGRMGGIRNKRGNRRYFADLKKFLGVSPARQKKIPKVSRQN